MFQCPVHQSLYMWNQATSGIRKVVFYTWRYFRINLPFHQSIAFQCSESNGKHALLNVFNCLMNITKPHCPICIQSNKNKYRPFIAQPAQYVTHRTISRRMKIFHFFNLFYSSDAQQWLLPCKFLILRYVLVYINK